MEQECLCEKEKEIEEEIMQRIVEGLKDPDPAIRFKCAELLIRRRDEKEDLKKFEELKKTFFENYFECNKEPETFIDPKFSNIHLGIPQFKFSDYMKHGSLGIKAIVLDIMLQSVETHSKYRGYTLTDEALAEVLLEKLEWDIETYKEVLSLVNKVNNY